MKKMKIISCWSADPSCGCLPTSVFLPPYPFSGSKPLDGFATSVFGLPTSDFPLILNA